MKLEMFWDFKDRSFRTEQLLIELYKQLKNSGANQLGVVSLDSNGMMIQGNNNRYKICYLIECYIYLIDQFSNVLI